MRRHRPTLPVMRLCDVAEAIEKSNDLRFELSGSVWTPNKRCATILFVRQYFRMRWAPPKRVFIGSAAGLKAGTRFPAQDTLAARTAGDSLGHRLCDRLMLSAESAYITAQSLAVDGGLTQFG
jgi:hypothetical protein